MSSCSGKKIITIFQYLVVNIFTVKIIFIFFKNNTRKMIVLKILEKRQKLFFIAKENRDNFACEPFE